MILFHVPHFPFVATLCLLFCQFQVTSMDNYEFVVSNGSRQRATSAARSHAVRSGLSRKSQGSEVKSKEHSQLTVHRRAGLQGRFRAKKNIAKVVGKPPSRDSSSQQATGAVEGSVPQGTGHGYEHEALPWTTGSSTLFRAPSQSRSDPFDALPLPQGPGVDMTIKFCEIPSQPE